MRSIFRTGSMPGLPASAASVCLIIPALFMLITFIPGATRGANNSVKHEQKEEATKKPTHSDETTALNAVIEIAKLTITSYESNFEIIKWVALSMSGLMALIAGGLAWYGITQFNSVISPMKKDYIDLSTKLKEETRHLEEVNESISKLEQTAKIAVKALEEGRKTHQALVHVSAAASHVGSFWASGRTDNRFLLLTYDLIYAPADCLFNWRRSLGKMFIAILLPLVAPAYVSG